MKFILLVLLSLLVSIDGFGQTRVTAKEWEAQARALAVEVSGGASITHPSGVEPSPAPWDTLLIDGTGAASGWKYEYVYGHLGEHNQRPAVYVTLTDGSEPHIQTREVRTNDGDNLSPLPSDWADTDEIIRFASAFPLKDENGQPTDWSIGTLLQTYPDAKITKFRLAGGSPRAVIRMDPQWQIEVGSEACRVDITLRGSPAPLRVFAYNSISETLGYCYSLAEYPFDFADFLPLAVGNEWLYEDKTSGGLHHIVVTGDTLLATSQLFVYILTRIAAGGEITESATCAVEAWESVDEDGAQRLSVRMEPLDGAPAHACVLSDTWPYGIRGIEVRLSQSVTIAGQFYPVESVLLGWSTAFGPGGIVNVFHTHYALGIGPYDSKYAKLQYARIGGEEYGSSIALGTHAPEMPPTLTFRVYPNPAIHRITVDAPETGILDVIDLTGRRIVTMPVKRDQAVQLDVSGFPAGLYLLQIGRHVRPITIL